MRHRRKVHKLGRKAEHRKALLSNLAVSLIMHKRIKTTLPKAKALRQFVEPLITRAKEDTTHNRRIAFRYLKNKYAVTELFREVAKKAEERPGGYTRILKLGFRKGDGAEMALIELVDYNPEYTQNPSALAGEKKRRTRRGGRKKAAETQEQVQETVEQEVTEQAEEQPKQEENVEQQTGQEETAETKTEEKAEADQQANDSDTEKTE